MTNVRCITDYTEEAVKRSQDNAEDWFGFNDEGWPRSWEEEAAQTERRGYENYKLNWEAPPIAGYEVLEAKGYVVRVEGEPLHKNRLYFKITEAGRTAIPRTNSSGN